MMRYAYLGIGCLIGLTVVYGQPQERVLNGTLTIKTAGRSTAVHGKSADAKSGDFLFCIDHDGSKPLNFSGEGRVIYRPTPVPGMPEALVNKTPESVAPALTVVTASGEAWLFVAPGQTAPAPPAGAKSMRIPVTMVRKTDWSTGSGPRRGTDISSCLMTAG